MKIKSLKELRKAVEKAIDNSLENEVFEVVGGEEIKSIETDVFAVYTPEIYERRAFGGIDDEENITHDTVKNGTIKIENITEFNQGYETANKGPELAVLIEYGHGGKDYYYDYPSSDEFCDPRPFINNTRKRLKKSSKHKEALKIGLKRNNIKTK
ncbi:hypothetical protein IJE86_03255 [bacterium]|nr:hypothetical protein [bacterium]